MEQSTYYLLRERKKDHYTIKHSVKEGTSVRGPWCDGSQFFPEEDKFIGPKIGELEGHFFVNHYEANGNGEESDTLVGIAHSREELSEKVYKCAMDYCKKLAGPKGIVMDMTGGPKAPWTGKRQDLEFKTKTELVILKK